MLSILTILLDFLVQNKDKEATDFDFEEELKKEQEEDKVKIKNLYLKILEEINRLLILNQNNNLVAKNLQTYVETTATGEESEPTLETFGDKCNESCGTLDDIVKSRVTLEKGL